MGRYTEASCKKCRAVGEKLFLKNKKCGTAKCILERRNFRPGMHGKARRKVSEYSIQLSEKQKLRNMYGMLEKQFRLFFKNAARMKGVTGSNLLVLLERRLDNAVMRTGFAGSRNQARQLVRHGHVRVNGRRVDIPSFLVSGGDKLQVKEKDSSRKLVKDTLELTSGRAVPAWLKVDAEKVEAEVARMPEVDDIDHSINVQLIVELYSK
jgi:small subunit ribosomal protein S4